MARRWILFDMDGVLVDYDPQVRVHHLATALGHRAESVHAAIYESGIEEASDRGELDAGAYLAALSAELDREVTIDAWVTSRRAATQARRDHLAIVGEFAANAKLGVLTNNGLLLAAEWSRIVPELFPLFSGHAYSAAQFGVAKPDPMVYQRCLAAMGADAATTLFIDDHLPNVEGARQAGLVAHHYVDAKSFQQVIRDFINA